MKINFVKFFGGVFVIKTMVIVKVSGLNDYIQLRKHVHFTVITWFALGFNNYIKKTLFMKYLTQRSSSMQLNLQRII